MSVSQWSLAEALRPGIAAVRAHWRPLAVIQLAALVVLIVYYQSPGFRDAAHVLGELKTRVGWPFAFVAGFLAGGVLPEIAQLIAGKPSPIKEALFNGMAYGSLGILIDGFYQLQTRWFGSSNDLGTLALKNFVDMGLAAPLVFIPYLIFVFELRKGGINRARMVLTWSGYRDKVLPALLPNWAFWIPVLFCVYAMPPDLQFSLSTLAEAAWSIVFVFIATREHA